MAINPNGSANNFFDHRNKPIIENIQKVSVKDQFEFLGIRHVILLYPQLWENVLRSKNHGCRVQAPAGAWTRAFAAIGGDNYPDTGGHNGQRRQC